MPNKLCKISGRSTQRFGGDFREISWVNPAPHPNSIGDNQNHAQCKVVPVDPLPSDTVAWVLHTTAPNHRDHSQGLPAQQSNLHSKGGHPAISSPSQQASEYMPSYTVKFSSRGLAESHSISLRTSDLSTTPVMFQMQIF